LDSDDIYPEPQMLDLQHAPLFVSVASALDNGEELPNIIEMVASYQLPIDESRSLVFEALLSDTDARGYLGYPTTPESGSTLESEGSKQPRKHHHHVNQDHGITHGYGFGWGWGPCAFCGGSGCTNCNGSGQVPAGDPASTGQGGAVDASDDPDSGTVGGDTTASLHQANYSTADPFAGMNGSEGGYKSDTAHSNSANPASTGWATSQDPQDWGRSLISNDFGMTFDASLRVTGAKEAPTVSGVALKAADTGRVLMIQRSNKDEKDPNRGTWEFPGGHHEEGDQTSLHAGIREWEEEVGQSFPHGGHVTHVHRSGPYALHTVVVPDESGVDFSNGRATVNPDDPDGDDHEQSAWWDTSHASKNPALRSELKRSNPFGEIKKAAELSEAAEAFAEALLHDEPEPALPSTEGTEEGDDLRAGNTASDLPGNTLFDNDSGDIPGVDRYNSLSNVGSVQEAAIIAEFQRTAGGQKLAKEAMKDFSFNEQQELINEGKGVKTRNFSDLRIQGTHYEFIPDDADDESIIWI